MPVAGSLRPPASALLTSLLARGGRGLGHEVMERWRGSREEACQTGLESQRQRRGPDESARSPRVCAERVRERDVRVLGLDGRVGAQRVTLVQLYFCPSEEGDGVEPAELRRPWRVRRAASSDSSFPLQPVAAVGSPGLNSREPQGLQRGNRNGASCFVSMATRRRAPDRGSASS